MVLSSVGSFPKFSVGAVNGAGLSDVKCIAVALVLAPTNIVISSTLCSHENISWSVVVNNTSYDTLDHICLCVRTCVSVCYVCVCVKS